MNHAAARAAVLALLWTVGCAVGCGSERPPIETAKCPTGERPTMDCTQDIGLTNRIVEANAGIAQLGLGVEGKSREEAAGEIKDATYQLALKLQTLCKEYNACIVSPAEYTRQAEAIRGRLDAHLSLVRRLEGGEAVGEEVAEAIYENARPVVSYRVETRGADGRPRVHRDGEALRSGDPLRFVVRAERPVHLYVLLLSSQGEASVIFPQPAIDLTNPLPAAREVTIPPRGHFELDTVTGLETLHILAAHRPIRDLEARLRALKGGDGAVAEGIGGVLCGDARARGMKLVGSTVECESGVRSRGITFDAGGDFGGQSAAMLPDDDVLVIQHRIDHR